MDPYIVAPRSSDALSSLVKVARPDLALELGSWEGRSALTFLLAARTEGIRMALICVDTWLGSSEHWEDNEPDTEWAFQRLRLVDGEPQILSTFRASMEHHKVDDHVSILRGPTEYAVPYLIRQGVRVGLVYVDADHRFVAVLQDLTLARGAIAPGGVISGDDWGWLSVRLAVWWFARTRAMSVLISADSSTYVLLQNNQELLRASFLADGWSTKRWVLLKSVPALIKRFRRLTRRAVDRLYLALRKRLSLSHSKTTKGVVSR